MSSERKNLLSVIGAPSSAGAYAPGQERSPDALRKAGLFDHLRSLGIDVHDLGDTEGFRWQVDRENPRAMNPMPVARAIRSTANLVERALGDGGAALVIGGDCTIELGKNVLETHQPHSLRVRRGDTVWVELPAGDCMALPAEQ